MQNIENLTTEAFLLVDLRSCADTIENLCEGALAEPPSGIYHVGRLEPVMRNGKNYYYREDGESHLVTDLNKVTKAVYDEEGKCVVSAIYMRNKERFLSNVPMLPYHGIHIAKELVEAQLDDFVAWRRKTGKTAVDVLTRHFRPDFDLEEDLVNLVLDCCVPITREVNIFLGEHQWNIFFAKLTNSVLRLERCMDWRAWEWENKYGDAFRAGRYK